MGTNVTFYAKITKYFCKLKHKKLLSKMKKMHRWFGLFLCLFLIGFCVSGIILNHHEIFSSINVSRSLMPSSYKYKNWNQGLMRGTLAKGDSIIIYGENGFFLTDKLGTKVKDFNKGMPSGVELRNIKAVTRTRSGEIWAVGNFQLFHLENNTWQTVDLDGLDTRLVDVTSHGDSVVVASRNHLWLSPNVGKQFRQIQLRASTDHDGKVSLLRTVWLIHSGALFGTIGKLVGDAVAIVLIILCISGVWFFIARKTRAGKSQLKTLYWVHRRIGRITIVLTLFVTITGWFLRPPAMVAIVKGRVPALPFTVQDSKNPWNDQLRAVRYDSAEKDWLIYTSKGFYALQDLRYPTSYKGNTKGKLYGAFCFLPSKHRSMARRFVQRSLPLEPQCAGRNAKGCANRQGYYDGGLQQRFQGAIPHRLLRGNFLAKDARPVPATTDVVAHSSTRNPHWAHFHLLARHQQRSLYSHYRVGYCVVPLDGLLSST